MKTATLCFDESGMFEVRNGQRETNANLLGGLITPGSPSEIAARATDCIQSLREVCGSLHATELRRRNLATMVEVRETLGKLATEFGAKSLVVVVPPTDDASDIPFALYHRVADAWLELGARIAWDSGVERVDVRPAQRTLDTVTEQDRVTAARAGHALEARNGASSGLVSLVQADVRITFERLGQVGGPKLGTVRVDSAEFAKCDPMINVADFLCNHTFHAFSTHAEREPVWGSRPPGFVVLFSSTAPLVRIHDHLRAPTPDFFSAATELVALRRTERRDAPRFDSARHGALELGFVFFQRALERLAESKAETKESVARLLEAHARLHLDRRGGDYEALWVALEPLWHQGSLADSMRTACKGGAQRAALHVITMECANHRGDRGAALAARTAFDSEVEKQPSLTLLARALEVRNLACVALQNTVPRDGVEWKDWHTALTAESTALVAYAEQASTVLGLATELLPASATSTVAGSSERAYRAALLRTTIDDSRTNPARQPLDPEVAKCFGSAGRCLAFVGRMEPALRALVRARDGFLANPADLRFNLTVLLRVLAEEARLSPPAANINAITLTLDQLGTDDLFSPEKAGAKLAEDGGHRFAVDALFRTLLWAPAALEGKVTRAWKEHLAQGASAPLRTALERHGGHPNELVARHAAELVTGRGRRDWFEFSLATSDAQSGIVRDFGIVTRRLLDGEPLTGECGSLTNPSFEYR